MAILTAAAHILLHAVRISFSDLYKMTAACKNSSTAAVSYTHLDVYKRQLYKGTAWPVASKSPYSLYNEEFATFSADEVYDQSDAEGFINLFSLPLKIRAIQKQNLEGIPEAQKALPKKIFKGGSFVE